MDRNTAIRLARIAVTPGNQRNLVNTSQENLTQREPLKSHWPSPRGAPRYRVVGLTSVIRAGRTVGARFAHSLQSFSPARGQKDQLPAKSYGSLDNVRY